MRNFPGILFLLLSIHSLASAEGVQPRVLHVAPNGRDSWSGGLSAPNAERTDGPLATWTGARDELRRLRRQGLLTGGATVRFQSGRYEQFTPVVMDAGDSGTPEAPITFQAAPGASVHITGGCVIRNAQPVTDTAILARLPATARAAVRVIDLAAQHLTDYGIEGDVHTDGRAFHSASGLRVICDGEPLRLARWPNEGFTNIGNAPTNNGPDVFTYATDEPSRWVGEQDPRGNGFWHENWSSDAIGFATIDPATRTITQRAPGSAYGFGPPAGFWYGYNLLSELDMPGECFLDRLRGRFYFWPLPGKEASAMEATIGRDFLVLNNASNMCFRGFVFENFRGTGLQITGGANVAVVGCVIRNGGCRALSIWGGLHHRVTGCECFHLGTGGLIVKGGDSTTLTPAEHVVDNNHVYDYARDQLTYAPAIGAWGCGIRVSHNLIHDGPHVAVMFGGRELTFEYNEVHHVCRVSGEMGAFYTGRDWTLVGNRIVGNYVHDIQSPRSQPNRAIMLDDGAAGITVASNLFVHVAEGVSLSAIGNAVEGNLFIDCHPAISCWQKWEFPSDYTNRFYAHPRLLESLAEVPVDQSPWKERYPWLSLLARSVKTMTPRDPATRSRIRGNAIWQCGEPWIAFMGAKHGYSPQTWLIEGNWTNLPPRFVKPEAHDFRLAPDSPLLAAGFKPLPLDQMGLKNHENK